MAGNKATSSVSTAITVRLPNDLLEAIEAYGKDNGLLNSQGAVDKRNEVNKSLAIAELIRKALDIPTLSDSVTVSPNDDLRDTVKKLSETVNTLCDRVISLENAIATGNITSEATLPAPDVLPSNEADTAAPESLELNQRQICDRFDIDYKNLSKKAGNVNMTSDAYIMHIAKEHGEIWEKVASKGSTKLWKMLKTITP